MFKWKFARMIFSLNRLKPMRQSFFLWLKRLYGISPIQIDLNIAFGWFTVNVVFNLWPWPPWGWFAFFLRVARASDKTIHIFSIFCIAYMQPIFGVVNIIGSPGKIYSLLSIQNCFQVWLWPLQSVLSVIIIIALQSTLAFGNARITLWRNNVLCS